MKKVILGISGGIASYKSLFLIRLLKKESFDVRVVLTESAKKFVTKITAEALFGHHVYDDLWENPMDHINLSRDVDLIVVAPATANTVAKIARGIADNLLTTLIAARQKHIPVFIAPAMNEEMWSNFANQGNIEKLKENGFIILNPENGIQACGEIGEGRMTEPSKIMEFLCIVLKKMHGIEQVNKIALITLGGTIEKIDSVRYIANGSSGKMGLAVVKALLNKGVKVVVIAAKNSIMNDEWPNNLYKKIDVETTQEMYDGVMKVVYEEKPDIFISAAAVSDYRVANPSSGKIKKEDNLNGMTIQLVENPDILKTVSAIQNNRPFCVGFAAESSDIEKNMRSKFARKKLDMIIGNNANAIGSDQNKIYILSNDGKIIETDLMNKSEVGKIIAEEVLKNFDLVNLRIEIEKKLGPVAMNTM